MSSLSSSQVNAVSSAATASSCGESNSSTASNASRSAQQPLTRTRLDEHQRSSRIPTVTDQQGSSNGRNSAAAQAEDGAPQHANQLNYDISTLNSSAARPAMSTDVLQAAQSPNQTHQLKTMTFNTHSIRNSHRRHTLFHHLMTCPHEIVAITETWCSRKFPPFSKSFSLLQSPPREHRGEGVMLAIKTQEGTSVMPLFEQFWTSRTISAMCRIKQTPVVVIAHYSSPQDRADADKELKFFNRQAQLRHPGLPTVILGDFNREPAKVSVLAGSMNLQAHVPHGPTRVQGAQSSILDYCLSNLNSASSSLRKGAVTSDHLEVLTTLLLPTQKHSKQQQQDTGQLVLKKSARTQGLKRILQDPSWPQQPFMRVAKQLGLTHISKFPRDQFSRAKLALKDQLLKTAAKRRARPQLSNAANQRGAETEIQKI